MDTQMDGRTAVVAGASKGIGLATTLPLTAGGVHVVAGSRSQSKGVGELVDQGKATFVEADLSDVSGPVRLVEAAAKRESIDVLVNSVGTVAPRPAGFLSITE